MFRIAEELLSGKYGEFTIYISVTNKASLPNNILLLKKKRPRAKIVLVKRDGLMNYYAMGTSKFLFTDVTLITSYIKRKGQVITQTWHGTPLKKLGFDYISDVTWTTDQKRAFAIANYCLFPNQFTMDCIVKSYRLKNVVQGTFLISGYPRNSIFYEKNIEKDLRLKLHLENKKIFVYMPTWRGSLENRGSKMQRSSFFNDLLKDIDYRLRDDQILYAKLHRLDNAEIDYTEFKHIKKFPDDYECYEFLAIADCLITDYSSVMFDFLNTRKKIILFTYDKRDYLIKQGTYFNIDELPFPQVESVKELIAELNKSKDYDDTYVYEKFCEYDKKEATELLCRHIINKEPCCREITPVCNKSPNILLYNENFYSNWITPKFMYFLDTLELDKNNYFISFLSCSLQYKPEYLQCVPQNVNLIGIDSYKETSYYTTMLERILFALYNRKIMHCNFIIIKLKQLFQREFNRQYFDIKFDKIIRFGGTDIDSLRLFMFSDVANKILVEYPDITAYSDSNFKKLLKEMEGNSKVVYFDNNYPSENFSVL